MACTKADTLEGLESTRVFPITPLSKTFSVTTASGNKITVTMQQLPVTPVYAFTDYCSKAQTNNYCIIDPGTPDRSTDAFQCVCHIISELWKRPSGYCGISMNGYSLTIQANTYAACIEDEQLDGLDRSMRAKWEAPAILNGFAQ